MNRLTILIVTLVIALSALIAGTCYLVLRVPASQEAVPPPADPVNAAATPDGEVRASIAGTWQSDDDANFVRELRADGTVVDTYAGAEDATTEGTWSFVADPSREQAELPSGADVKVIKIQFPEEALYFALTSLSPAHLELSYLSRGNTLRFTRVR